MAYSLREEFRLRKFGFSHDRPEDFYRCQWKCHQILHVGVRLILSLYTGAVLVFNLSTGGHNVMVYLTIWSYLVLTIHIWISTCLSIYGLAKDMAHNRPKSVSVSSISKLNDLDFNSSRSVNYGAADTSSEKPDDVQISVITPANSRSDGTNFGSSSSVPFIYKISWILSDVIAVFAMVVTFIYWFALYPSLDITGASDLEIYNDVNVHAVNSFIMFIETLISARPVRLLHFVYPLLYGGVYVLFAFLYWLPDKENHVIYSVLDFNKPEVVLLTVFLLAFVGIPLLQLFHYGVFRLKVYIAERCGQAE